MHILQIQGKPTLKATTRWAMAVMNRIQEKMVYLRQYFLVYFGELICLLPFSDEQTYILIVPS